MGSKGFVVDPGWRVILHDLGIRAAAVLKRAGLPGDLFGRAGSGHVLTTAEYFGLWRALEAESGGVAAGMPLALAIGQAISPEAFQPPVFAAFCSPDLATALARIALYKQLIGPMALRLDDGRNGLTMAFEWLDASEEPPVLLALTELVFFVQLARLGTREAVRPLRVTAPTLPAAASEFAAFFGVRVRRGSELSLTFSREDATRPFLTANDAMWQFFEPELRRRLAELAPEATLAERVRAALLELLPSGSAAMEAVAGRLALSTRTLQRRLRDEGVTFQEVLHRTREALARHYLAHTALSGAEISFLLGFEDPSSRRPRSGCPRERNSFFRAFQQWTGATPERLRGARAGSQVS